MARNRNKSGDEGTNSRIIPRRVGKLGQGACQPSGVWVCVRQFLDQRGSVIPCGNEGLTH
ncbi:hypothetical protein J6590_105011, partial [Homalodisca vitripennis]